VLLELPNLLKQLVCLVVLSIFSWINSQELIRAEREDYCLKFNQDLKNNKLEFKFIFVVKSLKELPPAFQLEISHGNEVASPLLQLLDGVYDYLELISDTLSTDRNLGA